MSRQHHVLKTDTKPYQEIESGMKTFEFRKNDRDFKVGDMFVLEECVEGVYTGRKTPQQEITYILYGGVYGIPEGYCIFQWNSRF